MISKFREVHQAIAYVCVEPGDATGRGCVEIFQNPEKTPIVILEPSQLGPFLRCFCRSFPEATAIIDPKPFNIPVAALQCRCGHDYRRLCPRACERREDRPVVYIMWFSRDKPPEETAKMEALRRFDLKAQQFLDEEKKKLRAQALSKHHRHGGGTLPSSHRHAHTKR